jgi:hypothetical protein
VIGFFLFAFAIFILLPVGVIFLLYWIPKRLGYPKLGKALAVGLAALFTLYSLFCF